MKQSRRRLPKLRYIVLIVLVGWAAFHYWFVQRPAMAALTQKESQLQTSVAKLEKQKQQLTNQKQLLSDPNYISRYASRWGYAKKGQVPFDVGH